MRQGRPALLLTGVRVFPSRDETRVDRGNGHRGELARPSDPRGLPASKPPGASQIAPAHSAQELTFNTVKLWWSGNGADPGRRRTVPGFDEAFDLGEQPGVGVNDLLWATGCAARVPVTLGEPAPQGWAHAATMGHPYRHAQRLRRLHGRDLPRALRCCCSSRMVSTLSGQEDLRIGCEVRTRSAEPRVRLRANRPRAQARGDRACTAIPRASAAVAFAASSCVAQASPLGRPTSA